MSVLLIACGLSGGIAAAADESPVNQGRPAWAVHAGEVEVLPPVEVERLLNERAVAREQRIATTEAARLRRLRSNVLENERKVVDPAPSHAPAAPQLPDAKQKLGALLSSIVDWVIPRAAATEVSVGGLDSPAGAEITELARALKNDPNLIYKYVYDNIAVEYTFAEAKGGLGALLDQSGNAFDQALLLRELLAAAGYPATLQFGRVELPDTLYPSLMGTASLSRAIEILQGGGNTLAANSGTSLVMGHIWVKVTVDSIDYVLDPYVKNHNDFVGIDLAAATGFSDSAFMSSALNGYTAGANYGKDYSQAGIESKLAEYATNLAAEIRTNHFDKPLQQVLGGRQIAPFGGDVLTATTHPYLDGTVADWGDDIDPTYRTYLDVSILEIDASFRSSEVYGRRFTIGFDSNDKVELRLDGVRTDVSDTVPTGSNMVVSFAIDHPFTGGAFADEQRDQNLYVGDGALYSIVNSWGDIRHDGVIQKRRKWLQEAQERGDADTDEAVLGEIVSLLGMNWVHQVNLSDVASNVFAGRVATVKHNVGIAGQGLSPYVDLPLSNTRVSHAEISDFVPLTLALKGLTSALEHGAIEQTQPSFKAVSTIKLLTVANNAGEKVYLLNSANAAAVEQTLLNGGYSSGELAQSKVPNFFGIMAEHRAVTVDEWSGLAQINIGLLGNAVSAGYLIDGDLSGGFATTPGIAQPTRVAAPPPIFERFSTKVADPVELQRGAFLLDTTDIALGAGVMPRQLGFQRSYSSGSHLTTGVIGNGWSHNLDITVAKSSNALQGYGSDSAIDAATIVAGIYTVFEVLKVDQSLDRMMVATIAQNWLVDQFTENVIEVRVPGDTRQFVKLADGSYNPAPGTLDQLTFSAGAYSVSRKDGTQLDFNTDDKISQLTDVHGNDLQFDYGSDEYLDSVTSSFGHSLTLAYDANNRIDSVTDNTGRSVAYAYDSAGDLTTFITALDQVTTYDYDADHRMLRYYTPEYPKAAAGQPETAMVQNTYDSLGRMQQQLDSNGYLSKFYVAGSRGEVEDPFGNGQVYLFSDSGKELSHTNRAGRTVVNEYDGHDRLTSTTLPNGMVAAFEYDQFHNRTKTTLNPVPGSPDSPIVQSFEYEPNYQKISKLTDARGYVTDYTYFPGTPNLQKVEQPLVNDQRPTASFTYTATGQVATSTDPEGRITENEYQPTSADQLIKSTSDVGGLNIVTEFAYDAVGNLVSQTDALGRTSTLEYDAKRQLTKTTAPIPFQNFTTDVKYDANGRVVETKSATDDPANPHQISRVTYSPSDKQTAVIDAAGNITTFVYDAADRLTSSTDAAGRETQLTYFADGQVDQVKQLVNGSPVVVRTNTYTTNGKPDTVTDGEGSTTNYDYDDFDRLNKTSYNDGTFDLSVYDPAGNVTAITTRQGDQVSYLYDPLNRETLKTPPVGNDIIATSYDRSGLVDTVTVNGTDDFVNGYDTAGRLTSVTRPDGKVVSYTYDANSSRKSLTYPGGALVINYDYDELGRTTKISEGTVELASYNYPNRLEATVSLANGTSAQFQSTINGDLQQLTNSLTGETPTYDLYYNQTGQLINQQLSDNSYAWTAPAPSTQTYTPNGLNQYASVDAVAFSYDLNGNLTNNGSDTFGYDYQNQLTSALVGGVTSSYSYDPFGRRATKTVGTSATELFIYDGQDVIEEYQAGAPDTLTARYVYGPGVDDPIYMERAGNRYYYHSDPNGSVIAVTDSSGTVVERYTYDPFGEVTSASIVGNPYLYTGRRFDTETTNYYYRARYYDPGLGRFLQADPLGISAGLNVYAYVGNDPFNFTDPSGLLASEVSSRGFSLFPANQVAGGGITGQDYCKGVCHGLDRSSYRYATHEEEVNLYRAAAVASVFTPGPPVLTLGRGGALVPKKAGDIFDVHPRVANQLNDPRMGRLQGKLTNDDLQSFANNPNATRVLDNRSGNINVIQGVEGKTLRITVPRDDMKIISVGPIRPNQVNNLLKKGGFTPLK
ncbi:MAG: hypothetical protein KUG81_03690 [Gammaproteobacteria bacterium]|nr:hypothetical protein [Gammaproteobacteria bacterium]